MQQDELKGVEEDWYQIDALGTDESDYVSGPLGTLTKYPRIAILCEKHQLKHIQFEPRLRYGLDFHGYSGDAILARLDDKTMHTFYWDLADSGDTYIFYKPDLRLLLKHKQAIFGVSSQGHRVALKFTEIPQPDAQMKSECSL